MKKPLTNNVTYAFNTVTEIQIHEHLQSMDQNFSPPLSSRITLKEYSKKLSLNADNFEAWLGPSLVGLINLYLNDPEGKHAFISNISVLKDFQGKGLAQQLLQDCLIYCRNNNYSHVTLKLAWDNLKALKLYQRNGFRKVENNELEGLKLNQPDKNEIQLIYKLMD